MRAASRAKLLGFIFSYTTYYVVLISSVKFLNFICKMKIIVSTSQGCCKAQCLAHSKALNISYSWKEIIPFLQRSKQAY